MTDPEAISRISWLLRLVSMIVDIPVNLGFAMSRVLGLLSRSAQTENGFSRLYIFGEDADAI